MMQESPQSQRFELAELQVSPLASFEWRSVDAPLLFMMSRFQAVLPRGRGVVPRALGRCFSALFSGHAIRTRHGATLGVVPRALDVILDILRHDRSWDYWILDTCASVMPRQGVFFDIGANVGYMSLELRQRLGRGTRVVAFEPQQDLAVSIAKSAASNGFNEVVVLHCAVGENTDWCELSRTAHSVHRAVSATSPSCHTDSSVRIVAIDDLVHERLIPAPDVIKIDIEGYEYYALAGAQKTIRNYRPHVVFEISHGTSSIGRPPKELFGLIQAAGEGDYEFLIANGSYRADSLISADSIRLEAGEHVDILARARSRTAESIGMRQIISPWRP